MEKVNETLRRGRAGITLTALVLMGGLGAMPGGLNYLQGAALATREERQVSSQQAQPSLVAGHKATSVRIYLVAIGDNGKSGRKIGCGDSLVAVTRPIAPTTAPLSAAFRLLLSNHRRYYGRSGLYNALYQSRLWLQRASVVNGKATVYLAGTMRLGGVCDDPRVGAQLRQAARQFPTVQSVAIYINTVPLWKRLSEK